VVIRMKNINAASVLQSKNFSVIMFIKENNVLNL